MSDTLKASVILGGAIIIAAILVGGFYQVTAVDDKDVGILGYRVNRFTGSVGLIENAGVIKLHEFPPFPLKPRPTSSPSP
jgi:hypothetical protein